MNISIFSFCLLSTKNDIFLDFLSCYSYFLIHFCQNFIVNDVYLHLNFIKKIQIFLKINHSGLKEVIAQLRNDLYYNELVKYMELS